MSSMMPKKFNIPQTVLSSHHAEPLSDEDKAKLAEEWATQTLDTLLAYTKVTPFFAKSLCEKVVKTFDSDDELSRLMLSLLKEARKGKPSGPRKKWNKSRYLSMLMHYEIRRTLWGRDDALEWTGNNEGIGINGEQVFNPKKVENRITAARKMISNAELNNYLPEWAKTPLNQNKRGE